MYFCSEAISHICPVSVWCCIVLDCNQYVWNLRRAKRNVPVNCEWSWIHAEMIFNWSHLISVFPFCKIIKNWYWKDTGLSFDSFRFYSVIIEVVEKFLKRKRHSSRSMMSERAWQLICCLSANYLGLIEFDYCSLLILIIVISIQIDGTEFLLRVGWIWGLLYRHRIRFFCGRTIVFVITINTKLI